MPRLVPLLEPAERVDNVRLEHTTYVRPDVEEEPIQVAENRLGDLEWDYASLVHQRCEDAARNVTLGQ